MFFKECLSDSLEDGAALLIVGFYLIVIGS
jgi:hypothetical protein